MVFSSHLFIYYFLPLALLGYYAAPRRARNLVLTAFSFLFYGWANPAYIVLLVLSTLIDYVCGLVLVSGLGARTGEPLPLLPPGGPRTRRQKTALAASMTANLLMLAFFKYFNFAVDSYNELASLLGFPGARLDSVLRVVLPVGISFYTFKSMSYAIDVYRGEARAMRNLLDFFCFESMFPDLVAGPIIRFQQVAEQLRSRGHSFEKFARGVSFFAFGLAKKVLLANPCGKVADTTFGAASLLASDAWYGVFAYALQIYFDFSGYSDMAIGLGLMLGFVFPKNFDSPYRSASITEFWRRWHISLSTWLRDYLYRPLGGNRKGKARTYLNLFTVMLLGGLWHGAAWTFVLWGAYHGVLLAAERWWGERGQAEAGRGTAVTPLVPRPLRVAFTFFLVLLSWVFFRAPDLTRAVAYFRSLSGLAVTDERALLLAGILYQPYYVLSVAIAAVVAWSCPQTWDFTRVLGWPRALASVACLLLALLALSTQSYNPFIYFIF